MQETNSLKLPKRCSELTGVASPQWMFTSKSPIFIQAKKIQKGYCFNCGSHERSFSIICPVLVAETFPFHPPLSSPQQQATTTARRRRKKKNEEERRTKREEEKERKKKERKEETWLVVSQGRKDPMKMRDFFMLKFNIIAVVLLVLLASPESTMLRGSLAVSVPIYVNPQTGSDAPQQPCTNSSMPCASLLGAVNAIPFAIVRNLFFSFFIFLDSNDAFSLGLVF